MSHPHPVRRSSAFLLGVLLAASLAAVSFSGCEYLAPDVSKALTEERQREIMERDLEIAEERLELERRIADSLDRIAAALERTADR